MIIFSFRASPSVTTSEEVDCSEKRRLEKEAAAAERGDDSEEVESEKEGAEIEDKEDTETEEATEQRSKKRHDSRAVADALETMQTQAEQPKPLTPICEIEHVQTDPPTSTDETHRQTDHTAAINNDEAHMQTNPPGRDGMHMTDSQAAQTHAQKLEKSYNLRSQVNPPNKLGYENQPPLHRDSKPETVS